MEEKFIIVSGKDRLCLAKGVDAVHKVIKEEGNRQGSSSHMNRSKSPERSPIVSRMGRSESQKSLPSPRNTSHFQQKFGRQERALEDRVRHDLQQFSRGSPQARAYGNDGARGRLSHSKSPTRSTFTGNAFNSYDGNSRGSDIYKNDGWDSERHGSDMYSGRKVEYPAYPQTLEEFELEYKREAMELGRTRDKDEDEENYKHREAIREMRENYMKRLAILRGKHAKQWEEFLQLDIQRQQRARQDRSASGFGGYNGPNYDHSGNPSYVGSNLPMDSRGRYPHPAGNYTSSRSHESYDEYQRQRHDDFAKAYGWY